MLAGHQRTGGGKAVLVRGPVGVGKTALLTAARAATPDPAATVLTCSCDTSTTSVAYGAVRRLFAPLVRAGALEPGSPLVRGGARLARSALVPLPGGAGPEPYAVQHGLYWFAVNAMSGAPLVLVVDDVQWCDERSLAWLGFLLRRAEDMPLVVLLAQRTGTPVAAGDALADLLALCHCHVLDLGPLAEDGVAELLTAAFGVEPHAEFTRQCAEVTGGYPLPLDRLVDRLRAAGTPPDERGARQVADVGRAVVADSALAVLARSSPDARAVARALAVLGPGEAEPVAALAEVSHQALLAALEELRDDRLLADTGRGFRHDAVRAAVLDDCAPGELTALRGRAAVLLNDAGRPAEEVAGLLLALPELTEPWMAGVLREAAACAEGRGAPTAGAHHLARALEADPTDVRVRVDLARMLAQTEPAAAVDHLERALARTTDPRERAPIAVQLALTSLAVQRSLRAVVVLTGVLDELDAVIGPDPKPADRELRLLVEATALISGADEKTTLRHAIVRSRAAPPPAGDTPAERQVLGMTAAIGALEGRPARLVTRLAEGAARGGDVTPGGWALFGATLALHLADEVDAALRLLDRLLEDSRAHGRIWTHHLALSTRATVRHWSGNLTEALADAQISVGIAEQFPWRANTTAPRIALAAVLARRQDPVAAQRALDDVDRPRDEQFSVEHHARLMVAARVRQQLDDPEGALELLLRCGRSLAEAGIGNPVFAPWWLEAACLLADLGRHGEGAALVDPVADRVERWGTARARGLLLTARGACTPGRRSVPLLAEAARTLADTPARLERARAEYLLGRAVLRHGSAKDAREHLRRATDLSVLNGDRALAAAARAALADAGGRVRTRAESPLDLLTGSERRVAERAATGWTNQAIAESLFLTVRTVEVHLSNAYRKLGVSGRADLPGALRTAPANGTAANDTAAQHTAACGGGLVR
ncbi:hypothetical protein GCM10009634_74290 [Saccharothrix xinjiangensis]